MKITVEHNINEVVAKIAKMKVEMPGAIADAINHSLAQARLAVVEEAKRVFDRPTPFTLNAFKAHYANKGRLEGLVSFDQRSGGRPFLIPQVEGGDRPAKRSEKWMRMSGVMRPDQYWVPAPGMKLDQYGNVPGSTITSILSGLGSHSNVGFMGNRTARSAKRNPRLRRYVVVRVGKRKRPGVYEVMGTGKGETLRPLLYFVTGVSYRPRLQFYEVTKNAILKHWDANLQQAIAKALTAGGLR